MPYDGAPLEIAVEGKLLYAAAYSSGLCIIDVADPSNMVTLGNFYCLAQGLVVDEPIVYLSTATLYLQSFLDVVDASFPSSPVRIARIDVQGIGNMHADVDLIGDRAYVTEGYYCGIRIVDVSEPAAPVLIGGYPSVGGTGRMVTAGDLLYISRGTGVNLLDVRYPSVPPLAQQSAAGFSRDVEVHGTTAYLAGGSSGLYTYDVSSPTAPVMLGFVATPGDVCKIIVQDDLAYVADGPAGLRIVDVSVPSAPFIAGGANTPSGAAGVDVEGDLAYVADSFAGVQVIDVSAISSPVIVGTAPTFRARDVAVRHPHAYIADADSGLTVVDVTVPTAPVVVAAVNTPGGFADGITLVDDLAIVADGSSMLFVDVSTPASPILIEQVTATWGEFSDVSVVGDLLYAAGGGHGLMVFDLSDPTSPVFIGESAGIDANAQGVAVSDEAVFVADGEAGLRVLPLHCGGTTTIGPSTPAPARRPLLEVHPNPVLHRATFTIAVTDQPLLLEIYDPLGRLVEKLQPSGPLTWTPGERTPRGVYFARLQNGTTSATVKFVVLE
jgi:hypothetical protein